MNNVKPTHIIILGGAGDLAQRKLFPSLFELFVHKKLPEKFAITGLARTKRTNEEYRELIASALVLKHNLQESNKLIRAFCTHLTYVPGSFHDIESYIDLSSVLSQFENEVSETSNKLFYLAVPPVDYEAIFSTLHKSKIAHQQKNNWARILVEKPFGSDYITAQKLDKVLSSLFAEEQIFRIDHYLAKDAIQNILSFRFANALLQSPWNREYIKEIRITLFEKIGVGTRGSFYDGVGALRDVGQNHALQMMALIAMDEPESLSAEDIRTKRAEILQKLIPITKQTVKGSVIRAQYDQYNRTPGVSINSKTETYFEFKAFIDTETWKNVPFYVRAGKALGEENVSIEIIFHDVAVGPFEPQECTTVGNKIVISISPKHSIDISLNAKKPGHEYLIETRTLSHSWSEDAQAPIDAYEKVLLDCIKGDQTLFTKTEEVLASWKFISSIIENMHEVPLQNYAQGSAGPKHTVTPNINTQE
jgi:glucose-6-phosphate 1-dehydrogenase